MTFESKVNVTFLDLFLSFVMCNSILFCDQRPSYSLPMMTDITLESMSNF